MKRKDKMLEISGKIKRIRILQKKASAEGDWHLAKQYKQEVNALKMKLNRV